MEKRGFGLIEVLLNSAIILLVLLATAQSITYSLQVKARADMNLRLAALAGSDLESLKSLPFSSDELSSGSHVRSHKDDTGEETFRCEWRILDLNSDLKQVELEAFSAKNKKNRLSLCLYISRPLGF
jgi:Tfp pilus assembly protein PilV